MNWRGVSLLEGGLCDCASIYTMPLSSLDEVERIHFTLDETDLAKMVFCCHLMPGVLSGSVGDVSVKLVFLKDGLRRSVLEMAMRDENLYFEPKWIQEREVATLSCTASRRRRSKSRHLLLKHSC